MLPPNTERRMSELFSEFRRNFRISHTIARAHLAMSERILSENSNLVSQSEAAVLDSQKLLRLIDRRFPRDAARERRNS